MMAEPIRSNDDRKLAAAEHPSQCRAPRYFNTIWLVEVGLNPFDIRATAWTIGEASCSLTDEVLIPLISGQLLGLVEERDMPEFKES